jgi:predicted nucleotidyltransferase
MGFLENYISQIHILCKDSKVKSLYSFGSVNTNQFDDQSDIDFVVDFSTQDPLEYSDNYFNLKFNLENILKRPIDLLENRTIKNPFLKQAIDQSKFLIYGN